MTKSCFNCKHMCNKGNRRFGCSLQTKSHSMNFSETISTVCENYIQKTSKKKESEEVVYYR